MTVFEYTSYKSYVCDRIKTLPRGGYGEFRRIALALSMHTTTVSQVFRKHKNLTYEQAARLCRLWQMSELESDYFLTLVEWERAGVGELRELLEMRLRRLRGNHEHAALSAQSFTYFGQAK
jgi:hypothetical protein